MSNLSHVVQQLKKERNQALHAIEQLDEALKALSGVGALGATTKRHGRGQASRRKRRTMSAAARRRIAAAQRALGEMEGSTPQQVSRIGPRFPQFHSQIFRFHAENCVDIDEATV